MYLLRVLTIYCMQILPWEFSFGIVTIQSINIRVTQSIGNDFNPHFTDFRRGDLNISDV